MGARRTKLGKDKGELNITSMMDMFTIVLVFLLKSFAAEGNLMTSAENLVLPVSAKSESPEEVSMTIVVDQDWILVDNIQVMKTPEARAIKDDLELKLVSPILMDKRKEEKEAAMQNSLPESAGKIVLQFDKNMEYDIVTKMVATCGFAGYTNVKFAVTKREEEG